MVRTLVLAAALGAALAAPVAAQGIRLADFDRLELPPQMTTDLALADVDGDGLLDVWVGNQSAPPIGPKTTLLKNLGAGRFVDVAASHVPLDPPVPERIAVGDLDGDGDPDVVFLCDTGAVIYRNNGTGHFLDLGDTLATGYENRAIALGDVDGDGDLDIWTGSGHDSWGVVLHRNDGTGAFTPETASLPPSNGQVCTYSIELLDADGDGDLDAAVGSQFFEPLQLWINDGTGRFTDQTATRLPAPPFGSVGEVVAADVDGDGYPDLMITYGDVYLYRNTGSGTFVDDTATAVPGMTGASRCRLADFDGDGDLDAWVRCWDGPRLLENLGGGVFSDHTATALPSGASGGLRDVEVGDLDGDGDPDVVVSELRVYSNLQRQLHWRDPPQIGAVLTMDLWGPGGAPWLLAASPRPAAPALPLPPHGTAWLDPCCATSMALGSYDGQGRANAQFAVSFQPALVGWSLWWQAVTLPALRLGNAEVTTFAGQ